MVNFWLIFLTGLTTGGLSCLAVQGGFLATALTHEVEDEVKEGLKKVSSGRLIKPLIFFLLAKLLAYTFLGFLLGWLGSVLQLSAYTRAILQIGIGIFMAGTALRMLDVHPIFRYFNLEPPKVITRFIRKFAKNNHDDLVTPTFLGLLTVFIPCGITQAMMALAVGSGNSLVGALVMFSFILGTTPLFFGLAYLATRLGEGLHRQFLKVAALTVLVLGIISVDSGLNLAGSPISVSTIKDAILSIGVVKLTDVSSSSPGEITVNVTNSGYSPALFLAHANEMLRINLVTNNTFGCSRAFVIPSLGIEKILPTTGTETIDLPAQPVGTLRFSCSMGMYRGEIQFQ